MSEVGLQEHGLLANSLFLHRERFSFRLAIVQHRISNAQILDNGSAGLLAGISSRFRSTGTGLRCARCQLRFSVNKRLELGASASRQLGIRLLGYDLFPEISPREGRGHGCNESCTRHAGRSHGLFLCVSYRPPFTLLPSSLTAELAFRVVNVLLLGYVIYSLSKALKTQTELSSVVLGFTFLVIEQCSLLLNTLDRAFVWSLVFAELVRIVGLLILAIFLVRGFQSGRRRAG